MKKTTKNLLIALGVIGGVGIIGGVVASAIILAPKNNNDDFSNDVLYSYAKNDQEKYINNNSLSLLFYLQENGDYYKNFLNTLLEKSYNKFLYSNLEYFLNNKNESKLYNISTGTTWMFDFQKKDNNLYSYYLATNIHVLNLGYTYIFNNSDTTWELFIPYTKEIATLYTFVTQAIGDESKPDFSTFNKIENNTIQSFNHNWVNFTNYFKEIIPLGALYNNNIANNYPYLGTITKIDKNDEKIYYINNNYEIIDNPVNNESTFKANDIGIINFEFDISTIDNSNYYHKNVNEPILNAIHNMFNINNSVLNPTNTYIDRVEYLLNIAKTNYDKNLITNNFIFSSFKTHTNSISIGGYPGIKESGKSYIRFNCKTLTDFDEINTNEIDINKDSINVWYESKNYYYKYNEKDNYLLDNLTLGHGSSGSMAVNQSFQIVGIYWGVVESNDWIKGIVTPIYDYSNSNSIIFRWLKYLNSKKVNTQVYNLFNELYNKNYFSK